MLKKLSVRSATGIAVIAAFVAGLAVSQGTDPRVVQGDRVSNVEANRNYIYEPVPVAARSIIPQAVVTTSNVTVSRNVTSPLSSPADYQLSSASGTWTADWKSSPFDAGLAGRNCEARATVINMPSGASMQAMRGSSVLGQVSLPVSTSPQQISINFPCDSSLTGYQVRITGSGAVSASPAPRISNVYVGLATNMANVAQAEFVGGGQWNAVSIYRSATAIQSTYTAFTNGVTGTPLGKSTTAAADTTVTFPNLPAGQYYVSSNFYNYMYAGAGNYVGCDFTIQEIDSNTFSGHTSTPATNPNTELYAGGSQLNGHFNFTTSGQRRFRIVSKNPSASGANSRCQAYTETTAGIYVYRFPSSSELVVTPERQNVFGGVVYTAENQTIFNSTAAPTAYTAYNNSTWNKPAKLVGKAQVTTTNSGNDLGFSIPNLPVGNYKIEISGLLNATNNGSTQTPSLVRCNFRIVETDSSGTVRTEIARQIHQDMSVITSGTDETRDYTNAFFGVYNNTSVATRNFRLEAQKFGDDTTGSIGGCQAFSSTGTNTYNSNIAFLITPLDQPSNSALYVQGPVLGAQTGAAIPAGYQFEAPTTTSSALFSQSSGSWRTGTGITLQPGVYLIRMFVNVGSTAPKDFTCGISQSPNAAPSLDSTNFVQSIAITDFSNTTQAKDCVVTGYNVVTSAKTFYPTVFVASPTSSAYTFDFRIQSIRLN